MKPSRFYQWSAGVDCPGVCGTFEAGGKYGSLEDWRTFEKIVSEKMVEAMVWKDPIFRGDGLQRQ